MLKAALEALKKKGTESGLQSQKPKDPEPQKPSPAFLDDDSDEAELLDLLNDIDRMGPTLKPTQKPILVARPLEPVADFDMGSSFGEISSQLDLFEPPREMNVEPAPTIATRSRPIIGQTPNPLLPHLIPEAAMSTQQNRLPFPFPPDQITPANIIHNIQSLPINGSQRCKFKDILAIKDRLAKIPLTAGVIAKAEQIGKDYLVTLVDEEGSEIQATIHEAAIREHQIKLHTGLLLVLANISTFRPTPKHCSLIVITRNIQTYYNNHFAL